MWAFDASTGWKQVEQANKGPGERSRHMMVTRQTHILIGCGIGNVGFKQDIFRGDLEGLRITWTEIKAINTGPSARHGMTAATETNGDVFFYGGRDSRKAQQDTWKLKLATNEWEQLPDGAEPKW